MYIGRTVSLVKRWSNHHRLVELEQMAEVKIAWMQFNEPLLLPEIEKALIKYFKPPLNYAGIRECKPKEFQHGKHPNSLANLTYHGGRPREFGEEKKRRTLSVTEAGWEGAREAALAAGFSSVSEFLEKWGRGEVKISA